MFAVHMQCVLNEIVFAGKGRLNVGARKSPRRPAADTMESPKCTDRPPSGFSPAPAPKLRRRAISGAEKGVSNNTVTSKSDRRFMRISCSPDLPDDTGDGVYTAEQNMELKQLKEKLQAMMRGRDASTTVHVTTATTEKSSSPGVSGVPGSDNIDSEQEQSTGPSVVDDVDGDEVAIVRVHRTSHSDSQDHQAVLVNSTADASNEAIEDEPGTAARERLFVCLEFCQCVCFVESKGGCSRTRQPYEHAVLYRL